ncbi:uncharacterized protein HKW66_Vig0170240 [Vigna angularis]|uniref:Uncharacterized protein n=1 Tax=Phaseolus angularis TaxID=3914 RepID=A0A8T0JPS6_PHAAN|nr:uncharacterized protein HKW66_Vig0170240 [Vigna angularis]
MAGGDNGRRRHVFGDATTKNNEIGKSGSSRCKKWVAKKMLAWVWRKITLNNMKRDAAASATNWPSFLTDLAAFCRSERTWMQSIKRTEQRVLYGDLILDEEARVQPKCEKVQREVGEHQQVLQGSEGKQQTETGRFENLPLFPADGRAVQVEEQGRGHGDDCEAGKHGGAADHVAGKHEEDEEGGGGGGKYEIVANKMTSLEFMNFFSGLRIFGILSPTVFGVFYGF